MTMNQTNQIKNRRSMGGQATVAKYGVDYMRRLGSRGGKRTSALGKTYKFTRDDHKKAGWTTKARYGRDYFVTIGKKGGQISAQRRKKASRVGK